MQPGPEPVRLSRLLGAPLGSGPDGADTGSWRPTIPLTQEVEELIYRQRIPDCTCSGCGRFLGALEVCPFCRTYNRKRLSVFLIKYSTPFLTVLGIALLYYLAGTSPYPAASVRDLGRRNNFAQVQVRGTVNDDVRFFPAPGDRHPPSGSLEFRIDDGTGVIKIRCYDDSTADLIKHRQIPGLGDRVTIRGSYQFRAKSDFIVLDSAHSIEIERNLAKAPIPIRQVGNKKSGLKDGDAVKVTGQVVRASYDRYSFVCVLKDARGNTLDAVLSSSNLELLGYRRGQSSTWKDEPRSGQFVTVDGTLQWNRYAKAFRVMVSSPERIGQVDSHTYIEHNR